MPRRQVRALAKSSMWKNRLLGAVLTGMGQIPIQRGSGDSGALDRAIEELRKGACNGIYPEGTRSLGRALRARSGVGYLARAVPEATIMRGSSATAPGRDPAVAQIGAPDVGRVSLTAFCDRPAIAPKRSPQISAPGCWPSSVSARLIEVAGASAAATVGRVPLGRRSWRFPASPGRQGHTGGGARPDRRRARLTPHQPSRWAPTQSTGLRSALRARRLLRAAPADRESWDAVMGSSRRKWRMGY